MDTIAIDLEDLGPRRGRYVARIEGREAELTFDRRGGGVLRVDHTGVPDSLGGRGIGAALVKRLVRDARALGLTIEPRCSFVAAHFKRNPGWADLLAPDA